MVYLPQLVGIDCPKCGAEVRLDRFLKDFTFREESIQGGNTVGGAFTF